MLRSRLQELAPFFKRAKPPVAESRDHTEVEFLSQVFRLLTSFKGQVFPTSAPGVQLTLVSVTKLLEDPEAEAFEFLVPVIVRYTGNADAELWSEAEKNMESSFLEAIRHTATGMLGDSAKVRLLRRRKSDPFKDDPRSLTILRFRVEG